MANRSELALFDRGPLVPGGALTHVVYLLLVVWIRVVTTVMVRRLGRAASGQVAA